MIALFPLIVEHMGIVFVSVALASLLGVVLGILSYWYVKLGKFIVGLAELIQTIPSLALLAMLMILFGLGNTTLIIGLILYALLPIVRNTVTGLYEIPNQIRDAAKGMGMTRIQRLTLVELPLAFPFIFSGIKIALVNSLSIAVMGVLIGAGGLGYPIYRGIQTRNFARIMNGAIPVVLIAIVFDTLMTKLEKKLGKYRLVK